MEKVQLLSVNRHCNSRNIQMSKYERYNNLNLDMQMLKFLNVQIVEPQQNVIQSVPSEERLHVVKFVINWWILILHIVLLIPPGHNTLMATMLNEDVLCITLFS